MFISVHIIVKETTDYGALLFEISLLSILEDNKGYLDEIILYDDGCSDFVKKMYCRVLDKHDIAYTIWKDGKKRSFSEKRNVCMEHTSPKATHIHWIDSDDIYYPNTLIPVKENILKQHDDCGFFINRFLHTMGDPWHFESIHERESIFKYNPSMRWEKNVHEHIDNDDCKKQYFHELVYYHAGYSRSIVATAIRWLYFAVLEGIPNHYFNIKEPMYGLGLDKIIDDRIPRCAILGNEIVPKRFIDRIAEYGVDGEHHKTMFNDWQLVVNKIDIEYMQLVDRFRDDANKDGNWGKCIQYVIDNKLWETL
jgi:hypothetical protein